MTCLRVGLFLLGTTAWAQQATTVVLGTSANPAVFGQQLTITATVSPSGAGGRVTFYDGTVVLGTAPVASGKASLTTSLLPSGMNLLKAYYGGGNSFEASTSVVLAENVATVAANGFLPPSNFSSGVNNSNSVVIGDFNADGKLDCALGSTSGVVVFLGSGNGTFSSPIVSNIGNVARMATGDFDGDGKTDIAFSNSNAVGVALGNGDGTFRAPVTYGASGGSIVVADFNGDGVADLATSDSITGNVDILLGSGDGTFTGVTTVSTGFFTSVIAAGDFNADGKADLAAESSSGWSVKILLGKGDGTFQLSSASYGVAPTQLRMAVGDFNGDGKADVIVTGLANVANVLLGNGDGTFQSTITTTSGAVISDIAVGDLNGDGKTDVVAGTIAPGAASYVTVLYGNGDGTFQTVNYPSSGSNGMAIADFNGDGRADIAGSAGTLLIVLGEVRPTTTTILTSSANPSKQGQAITLTATVAPAAATGTVAFYDGATLIGGNPVTNGQGMVTVNSLTQGSHSLAAVYSGDSQFVTSTSAALSQMVSGALQAPTVTLMSSANPANYGQSVTLTATLSVTQATGTITFLDGTSILGIKSITGGRAALSTSLLGSGTHALTALYNGDGSNAPNRSAALTESVRVTNLSYGFLPVRVVPTGLPNFYNIVTADFNGDGKPDLALVNYEGGSIGSPNSQLSILLGKGDGTFLPAVNYPAGNLATSLTIGDFNGDGAADLVLGNGLVFLGNGDGTFRQGTSAFSGLELVMAAADFNGDGKTDLAMISTTNGQAASVLLGNGDGTFQPPINISLGLAGNSVAAGDFNGDGKTDLAVSGSSGASVQVLLGNGDGTFRQGVIYPTGAGANFVAIADFNGDGKSDMAVTNGIANTLSVLLGNGDGTFQPASNYPGGSDPLFAVTVDFNGDGKPDLAVADLLGNFEVLLGKGDGTFQTPVTLSAGAQPKSIAVADFNGDGRPDLAVANYGDSTVSILLATGDAHLQLTSLPANEQAGSPFQVVAEFVDSGGNVVTGAYVPVTLTSSPAGVNLTAAPTNGVVTFPIVTLSPVGTYTVTASAAGLTSANTTVSAMNYPTVAIDTPMAGTVPAGPVVISGWAMEGIYQIGTAISSVQILLDGTVAGNASYGVFRLDVCDTYPERPGCPNVGYTFTLNLPAGTHTITVTATDSGSPANSASKSVTLTATGLMMGTRAAVYRNNSSFLEDTPGEAVYHAGSDRFVSFSGPGGFMAGDVPVGGDWTGDGVAKVGIYRGTTGTWYLDANNNGVLDAGDFTYQFGGLAGDMPFAGDWMANGKSCVGIYRANGSFWLLDLNCNGSFEGTPTDAFFPFGGLPGDVPVVGAWTGGGTRVGVVRKYAPGGVPVGNPFLWVQDGGAANAGNQPANHPAAPNAFAFGGLNGDVYVTGDWYNTGVWTAGVYRAGFWVLDAALPGAPQAYHIAGLAFGFGGLPGDIPVAAKW